MTEQQTERLISSIERLATTMEMLQVSNAALLAAITVEDSPAPEKGIGIGYVRSMDDPPDEFANRG